MTTDEVEYWYRYYDFRYAAPISCGEYDEEVIGTSTAAVHLEKFEVIKHTPKGVWINMGLGDKKFVLKCARKRFACPTIEEAKESFLARKKRQLRIHQARVEHILDVMYLIENDLMKERYGGYAKHKRLLLTRTT